MGDGWNVAARHVQEGQAGQPPLLHRHGAPPLLAHRRDDQHVGAFALDVEPVGGTALYDAVAEALPTAEEGRNRKKALLVISDGNDTNSSIGVTSLRQRIRESEVLVYALGVDSNSKDVPRILQPVPPTIPFPFPALLRIQP